MSKVLISHQDMDGVVCAILFKTVYPDGTYYLENYDTVDERIKQVLDEKPDILFITDISPSKEIAQLINQEAYYVEPVPVGRYPESSPISQKIFLFDHHKTALYLKDYRWAEIDTFYCGASLFYKYLLPNHREKVFPYCNLVCCTRDYDLWIHLNPHSSTLNSLLYIYGHERFVNRFLANPSVELTETEKLMLEIEAEKQEKYIQEAAKTAIIDEDGPATLAVVFAEKYISQLGNFLLEETECRVDIVAIVNAQKGTVSLRSKKIDVSAIAKALGGGGHKNAAGFKREEVTFEVYFDVADIIFEQLERGEIPDDNK